MVQVITSDHLVEQIDEMGVEAIIKAHRKPPLPTRILRDLYELYHDQDTYLEFLACYPLIPSDLADTIASNLDPGKVSIARGLAQNPRCPQQGLARLADYSEPTVRLALAANPNLTPKEFQLLVADKNELVRAAIAENPSLPNPLQCVLATDEATSVKVALANRKNLDLDVALHLSESEDLLVRAAIIINCNLEDELLQCWADTGDERTQMLLLKRATPLPPSTLQALRLAPSGIVHRTALKQSPLSSDELLYLAESEDTRDRLFLAEQTDLPSYIQRILAKDPSPKVRRKLAANSTIHQAIALHIAASIDLGACHTLAKNVALGDEVIRTLCLHPEDEIALLIAYRDDLNGAHYDLLFNHRHSTKVAEHLAYRGVQYAKLTEQATSELSKSQTPTIRAHAAESLNLSEEDAQRLAIDNCPTVRLTLSQNSAIDETILQTLYKDTDREIVLSVEAQIKQRSQASTAQSKQTNQSQPLTTAPQHKTRDQLFKKILNFFGE